jgi:predicted nucleotidyltransferase
MISEDTIAQAVATLVAVAKPQRIVLFGSCARGDAHADSDLDFMVVEDEVADRAAEMLRLSRALRPLRVPVDVLVVSKDELDRLGREPGSVYWWALKEGRVLHG